jgi:hypothetical protein
LGGVGRLGEALTLEACYVIEPRKGDAGAGALSSFSLSRAEAASDILNFTNWQLVAAIVEKGKDSCTRILILGNFDPSKQPRQEPKLPGPSQDLRFEIERERETASPATLGTGGDKAA